MKYPLGIFSTIATVFFASVSIAQQGTPPVTVAHPVVKTIVEDDEFVGRFEARADVSVRARVTGYLQEVHFADGSLVEKNQLLFTIDQRQFQTALRQAQASIDVAQATYDFAEEQLERAQSLIANQGNRASKVLDESFQDLIAPARFFEFAAI